MAQCEGIGPHIDPPPYVRPTPVYIDDLEVTENGEYTPDDGHAYGTVTVNVSGGGGSENIVMGTFTPSASGVNTLNIDYSGTGYPMSIYIYTRRPDTITETGTIQSFMATKYNTNAPTYTGSQNPPNDVMEAVELYKNSADAGVWNWAGSAGQTYYNTTNPGGGTTTSGHLSVYDNKTIKYYAANTGTTTRGFKVGKEYVYHIEYSS